MGLHFRQQEKKEEGALCEQDITKKREEKKQGKEGGWLSIASWGYFVLI